MFRARWAAVCVGLWFVMSAWPGQSFAVTGKMHCYTSAEGQRCAGSPQAAGEAWLLMKSGGAPIYPDSRIWRTAGNWSDCEWSGWGTGGHLASPPGSIISGGRYTKYAQTSACYPTAPNNGTGSPVTNAGYSTPVQECPSGWTVDADGFCFSPPPEELCAAKVGQAGPVLRGNFDGFENDTYTDADGCSYEPVGSVSCVIPYSEENAQRDYFPPVCSVPSQYSGEYVPQSSPTQLTQPEPAQATTDSRESSETSVTDPVQVTNNPDGSTTTTQTTTRTKVAEAGTTVQSPSASKSVVVSHEGGRVIVTVTETATTNMPDGRVVTTTTVTKSVTSTPKQTTTVTADGDRPVIVVKNEPETTETGQTRTTVTAYPDGRTESQTETTGGGGQGAEGVNENPGAGSGEGEPAPDGSANAGRVTFPAFDEAPGFGESVSTFLDDVGASPIGSVADSLTGLSDAGGTCNAPSFSLFGESFTFDFHCQIWPTFAPVLEAAALAAWAILAVLILLSA